MAVRGLCLACGVLGAVFVVCMAVAAHFILSYRVEPPEIHDAWWGPGERPAESDTSLLKVNIRVHDAALAELKQRLQNTRYQFDLEEGDFRYGFQTAYMKQIVQYWTTDFDWRKQEALLNKYEHYKTEIDGLKVHYVHAKPEASNKVTIPLLMVHGWPGSVWEFYKVIPLLTDPTQDTVFEVICPSIPGYGFSDSPSKKGFDQMAAANIFMKLMKRLGFERYYVQGGDWGAAITQIMAASYPQYIIGLHTNMFAPPALPKSYIKQLVGMVAPWLVYDKVERDQLTTNFLSRLWEFLIEEGGYFHEQATKPDTIGMALTDSPVGLAAYILEKFGSATNLDYRNRTDGGLTEKFSLDDLLTNVMIYWTNRNIVSSMRFYKERFRGNVSIYDSVTIGVPSGLAQYPNEITITPRTLAADRFTDIVQYSILPRGGHFAAFEEPEIFYADFLEFVQKVESRKLS